jgi:predicted RND superfamily exporter protein
VDPPFVVRRPWIVLVLAALATVAGVAGALRIDAHVDFVDTVPDHAGLGPYRNLLAELDGVRFLAVYMAHDAASGTTGLRGDAFDALVAEQQALTRALADAFGDRITHTLSVYEAMRAGNYMLAKVATAGNPPASSYALPDDAVTWRLVKDQALAGDTLDEVLARDGSSALLLVFLARGDSAATGEGNGDGNGDENGAADERALAGDIGDFVLAWADDAAHHPVTTDHAPSGLLWSSHVTDERNREETVTWGLVAAAAVAVALVWVTRSVLDALVAVVALAAALAWTYGVMGWSGIPISFLTFVLAPVVMGVGIDYAVHVLHRARSERDAGRPHGEAMAIAVRRTGRAVRIAAVTTTLGLAVLLFIPAPLFAEIGGVAALGIAFGFVASVTLVPALRLVLPARGRSRKDAVGIALASWSRRARGLGPTLVVLAVVAGAAFVAATQTRVESGSAENELPQDDPLIVLQHRIEREYGAFQRAYLVVEGEIADAEALRALHAATVAARAPGAIPLGRDAASVTDLLIADAATDDGAVDIIVTTLRGPVAPITDEDRLPATDADARAALGSLFTDPLWRTLAPFTVSRDHDLAVVAVKLDPWPDQDALRDVRDALERHVSALQDALGPEYAVAAAGAPVNRAAVLDQTPRDVAIATAGVALVVVAALLVGWRREGRAGVRAALLAGAVVAAATVLLLAAVPLLDAAYDAAAGTGAPANNAALSDMFLVAFALTAAMGVDDVVHVAERAWEGRRAADVARRARHATAEGVDATHGDRDATAAGFASAGRAITGTSLTTFIAFAPLAGVYFLQSKNLAILAAAGVVFAYALTVLLAPRWLVGGASARG